VEGDYCPGVVQECIEHHPEYKARKDDPTVSERCLRFREPSRCVSKQRLKLSFCVDRYEYPNQVGELPRVLTSWREARVLCEREGKRLCTEAEFNFACEGPDMLPHVYGYTRDQTRCNIDKPRPAGSLAADADLRRLPEDRLVRPGDPPLDQRHKIGSTHAAPRGRTSST
jgi:hypothetical protein